MVATHAGARGAERSGGLSFTASKSIDHRRNLQAFAVGGAVTMLSAVASGLMHAHDGSMVSTTPSAEFLGWYPMHSGVTPDALVNSGITDGLMIGGGALSVLSVFRAAEPTSKLATGLLLAAGVTELAVAGNLIMHNVDSSAMFSSSSVNPQHIWTIGPINGATIDSVTTAAHNTGMEVGLGLTGLATVAAVPYASRRK